jgi:hypothetical protein
VFSLKQIENNYYLKYNKQVSIKLIIFAFYYTKINMKKATLTEDKAEKTPTGGVLVGKRKGQTIIHNKGTLSGYLVGKTHAEGGIKAINKSTGQPLEMQGGEVVITAPAVSDQTKNEFNGKMMTNREILSQINVNGGGVAFANGGDIPKDIKRTGASYKYGGKTMTDHEIYKRITGGHLAEGMTLTQIAKMHKVSLKELQKQVDMGMKAESEHTSSKREQMKIVKDHLYENPKYYSLLKKAGLEDGGSFKDGGYVSYKDKYNRKYKYKKNTPHTLEEISKDTGVSVKGLQRIYNKGIGAYKTNPQSVRPNVKSKEQWAMARVYSAVMGGKASKVDSNELKMYKGGSLVKDAKSGNTPARDLNNYNDVLDLEADGMVGADSGLFADGGSLKPYDANMEGDSADMMFARGGATDVIVNNWSDVPDSFKNVRLPKSINWSPNPSNDGLHEIVKPFLSTDSLREALSGINFDDNGITVTNAHILLTIPTDDHDFQGVYKKVKGDDGFAKIDVKYPNYERVIPTEKDITKVIQYFDINKLLTYCKVASNYTKQEITFKINDEQMSFMPEYIIAILTSWIKLTGITPDISFQNNKQALVFSLKPTFKIGKDVIGLLMPYIYGSDRKLGARNEDKKAELNVYYDFDDNEIHNSDGSVVYDWDDKPKKERAKRKPKTTASKTSKQIDLTNTKIWIGDNPELSKKVQKRAFELGWFWTGKTTITQQEEKTALYFSENNSIMYSNLNKDWFDKQKEQEIFESDLFPTETTTAETEKIEVFRLLGLSEDEIKSTWLHSATELLENLKLLESTFPERQNFPFRILDIKENLYGTLNIGRGITTPAELITYIMDKPYYKDYDWTEFFAYGTESTSESSSKFSDDEIDLFNQIDIIVKENDVKSVDMIGWRKSSGSKDFFVISELTGAVYSLRSFDDKLGTQVDDINRDSATALIKDYLDWKESTPTATEKPVEQPKPSKTDKPKRNFELERKYLSQRISDLAKELELKKPILSNEEVGFYQREINSFILKLRKLNDAEMSLKSIEERVRGVYDLKISSFESEYPETDMVSINGLKSQLTEKEYFNVRTPEFKSFFGDWETAYLTDSYAGVSKVINPITKEPQPVFHGTNVLFVDWKTYDTNNAHYFAVKREMSEFFATTWEERSDKAGVDSEILKRLNPNRGSFLLRCFIDVKNPIDFSRFGVEKYPIREFLTFLRVNYNIGDFDFWTNITSHSGLTQDTEVYAWQIIRLWQSFTKYVKVFTTYDGYIFYEYIPTKTYGGLENASLSYCAFDSNQIKFTDAYEFNALSNDSRFDLGGIL